MSKKPPIVIIAAARSGTKILRDVLSSSDDFVYYPYDVNYIWKYKSHYKNHDELDLSDLTDEKAKYIRNYFSKLNKGGDDDKRLLEKTVSNALRIDFVKEIFPESKIIHLYRDGRNVTASLKSCWTTPTLSSKNQSWELMFRKAIDFPFLTSMPYFLRYVKNNISLLSSKKTLQSWGPRFSGIDETLAEAGLIAACALQWSISTQKTISYLDSQNLGEGYIDIRYEDLVKNPRETLAAANHFLEINNLEEVCSYAEATLRQSTSSTWETLLTAEERNIALPILSEQLSALKYI